MTDDCEAWLKELGYDSVKVATHAVPALGSREMLVEIDKAMQKLADENPLELRPFVYNFHLLETNYQLKMNRRKFKRFYKWHLQSGQDRRQRPSRGWRKHVRREKARKRC